MKKIAIVLGLVSALGLSACGTSTADKKASLDAFVASIGASSNLQVTASLSDVGPGSTEVSKILKVLQVDWNISEPGGNAISSSTMEPNEELSASISGTNLIDLRIVSNNAYFYLNTSALANIPGEHISQTTLNQVGLVIGGRWIELPASLINSVTPKSAPTNAKTLEDRAMVAKAIDAITNVLVSTPVKNLGNGAYSTTGSVRALADAVYSTLKTEIPTLSKPTASTAKGFTYGVQFTTDGSNATGGTLSVTGPAGKGLKGDETLSLTLTFAHADTPITVPANAQMLPKSFTSGFTKGFLKSTSSK